MKDDLFFRLLVMMTGFWGAAFVMETDPFIRVVCFLVLYVIGGASAIRERING
jgi:hypothetical protein